jgi:hypothetical protein
MAVGARAPRTGLLIQGSQACESAGRLRDVYPHLLAHLVSGAVSEAVFLVAEATSSFGRKDCCSRRRNGSTVPNVHWLTRG